MSADDHEQEWGGCYRVWTVVRSCGLLTMILLRFATLPNKWLFYDLMKAEGVVGQFDNCLFSLHRPQIIGRTNEQDAKDGGWSTMGIRKKKKLYAHICTSLVSTVRQSEC
ncbi:hypothetical protein V8E52_011837 [Russula decolorans]